VPCSPWRRAPLHGVPVCALRRGVELTGAHFHRGPKTQRHSECTRTLRLMYSRLLIVRALQMCHVSETFFSVVASPLSFPCSLLAGCAALDFVYDPVARHGDLFRSSRRTSSHLRHAPRAVLGAPSRSPGKPLVRRLGAPSRSPGVSPWCAVLGGTSTLTGKHLARRLHVPSPPSAGPRSPSPDDPARRF